MDKARYLVEAHVLEGRSVSELAAAHGVHRSWIYKLLARYRAGGYEALGHRSKRPRSCPNQTPAEVAETIVALRKQLGAEGHECGAATIAYHLAKEIDQVPSVSTIWRVLKREGLVVPQPQKRPRSSLIRFAAELPNEMWQADITHWRLAGGGHVEILNMLDDHSRLFLASRAYGTVRAADVVEVLRERSPCMASQPACSATTAPSSQPPRAVARCSCRQSSSDWGSPPRTPGPTTRRPAARSSACIRRSSATWQTRLR